MPDSTQSLQGRQGENVNVRIGKQFEQVIGAAVVESVGLKANWSEKHRPAGRWWCRIDVRLDDVQIYCFSRKK